MNLKRIKFFLIWIKNSIKLVPINLKWLIAMIGYKKLAYAVLLLHIRWIMIKTAGNRICPEKGKTYLEIFKRLVDKIREKGGLGADTTNPPI